MAVTGLVWEQSPNPGTIDWGDAFYWCANSGKGGRLGWHIPTVEQLASILDVSCNPGCKYPKLPAGHPFTNLNTAQSSFYWSATSGVGSNFGGDSRGLGVNFYYGIIDSYDKLSQGHFWCVRGGQGVVYSPSQFP